MTFTIESVEEEVGIIILSLSFSLSLGVPSHIDVYCCVSWDWFRLQLSVLIFV
jgi:hypothetical protein